MHLYGLIGYPLSHSFSSRYFSSKFNREGIDCRYENFPIESIDQIETLIKSNPDLMGLNVTIPYKETVIPYLDALSKTARAIQAVNTICLCRKSGSLGLIGHNTDVIGFEKSLNEVMKRIPESALILGTGGASKAVIYVLREMGIRVTSVSRRKSSGTISYEEVTDDLFAENLLIVNTTPLGMYPDSDTSPEIPYHAITQHHILFDLVYNPETTQFMKRGEEMGANVCNGEKMLIYQADAAWEIWNRNKEDIPDI